jgi:hypothetical protein
MVSIPAASTAPPADAGRPESVGSAASVVPAVAADPLLQRLTGAPVPRHIAIIMDGNGRWARERHMPRPFGHRAGMKAVRAVVEASIAAGVEWLSLFAFSQENWQRPVTEISALMSLLEEYVASEIDELRAQGVRVRVVSAPSLELFAAQDAEYRAFVLPAGVPRVAVEAAHSMSWHRWVGDTGAVVGIDTFGASAPAPVLFKEFGITAEHVVAAARGLLG